MTKKYEIETVKPRRRGRKESSMLMRSTVPAKVMYKKVTLLLRQDWKNKLTPTFRPEPYRVLDKSGNSV